MRSLSKLVSLALFAGGSLACAGDPSQNVSLVVTISNGNTTSGEAGAPGPAGPPGSGPSDDAGQSAADGGAPGQGKADGANQEASPSSTCQLGTACDTGTIIIEAGVNHCPEIITTSTRRADAATSEILVAAADRDGDRLTYQWTATSGQFSEPMFLDTTYTCTMPGNQTLTVVVSDGQCDETLDIPITCP